ncbi:MAG: 23S rRNA (pseudouridine(1915)-N(3))-methyltransferase RlmH, partial [Bacilli bacterium]|nr:23S rRNA (pseudouridine(1915)-N(3))-methyltransferase RlmH [Bacilli bacterium]
MINIICVGKLKDKYLVDMANDYLTRLTKYHKVNVIELKDSNIKD